MQQCRCACVLLVVLVLCGLVEVLGADSEVSKLAAEVSQLRRELLSARQDKLHAEGRLKISNLSLEEAIKLSAQLAAEREAQIQIKIHREEELQERKRTLEGSTAGFERAEGNLQNKENELRSLHQDYQALKDRHEELIQALKKQGLSQWMEEKGRSFLPPSSFGMVNKTSHAMKPVVRGVSGAISVNREIAKKIEGRVKRVAPRANPRLVISTANYFVLLVPLLALSVAAVRFARLATGVPVSMVTGTFCVFLGILALTCAGYALVRGTDPLCAIQAANEVLLAGLLVVLAAVYIVFLTAITLECYMSADKGLITELLVCVFVAYHFFVVVWRRAMVDERPTIRPAAYLLYLTVFALGAIRRFNVSTEEPYLPQKLPGKSVRRVKPPSSKEKAEKFFSSLAPSSRRVSEDNEKKRNSRDPSRKAKKKAARKTPSWLD